MGQEIFFVKSATFDGKGYVAVVSTYALSKTVMISDLKERLQIPNHQKRVKNWIKILLELKNNGREKIT